jgi:hypothetical protein
MPQAVYTSGRVADAFCRRRLPKLLWMRNMVGSHNLVNSFGGPTANITRDLAASHRSSRPPAKSPTAACSAYRSVSSA